jgi:sporulation protein YlmC with PRC-barrel domain
MLLNRITKKEVLDVNANRIGNIVDVDLDVNQGTINHFMLKIGAFKRVPLTPDKIDKIGQKIILKVSRAEFEKPPVRAK